MTLAIVKGHFNGSYILHCLRHILLVICPFLPGYSHSAPNKPSKKKRDTRKLVFQVMSVGHCQRKWPEAKPNYLTQQAKAEQAPQQAQIILIWQATTRAAEREMIIVKHKPRACNIRFFLCNTLNCDVIQTYTCKYISFLPSSNYILYYISILDSFEVLLHSSTQLGSCNYASEFFIKMGASVLSSKICQLALILYIFF